MAIRIWPFRKKPTPKPTSTTGEAGQQAAQQATQQAANATASTASSKSLPSNWKYANSDDWKSVSDGSAFKVGQWKGSTGAFMGNLEGAAAASGQSIARMAGGHAIRGAAWGAVGGGTIESMQGGSFWDGAKQGAFNGAVGWTGYRMAMKGVGATSMNPFAGENKGVFSAGKNMFNAFSGKEDVSKQAQAILSTRQNTGVARSVMRQREKANKA